MIKSRKKVIYVSTIAVVLLSCVGAGSYFIATNFQEPIASQFETMKNQYLGATTSLNKPYNINQDISFNDWIIQNMPSKIEFFKNKKSFLVSAPSNSLNPQEIPAFQGLYSDIIEGNSYTINFLTLDFSNKLPLNSLNFSTKDINLNYLNKSYSGETISDLSLTQDTNDKTLYKLDNFNGFNITKTVKNPSVGEKFNYSYSVVNKADDSPVYSQIIKGNNAKIDIIINGTNTPATSTLEVTLTQDITNTNIYKFSYKIDGISTTSYKDYYSKTSTIILPSSINQLGLFDFISFIG